MSNEFYGFPEDSIKRNDKVKDLEAKLKVAEYYMNEIRSYLATGNEEMVRATVNEYYEKIKAK